MTTSISYNNLELQLFVRKKGTGKMQVATITHLNISNSPGSLMYKISDQLVLHTLFFLCLLMQTMTSLPIFHSEYSSKHKEFKRLLFLYEI